MEFILWFNLTLYLDIKELIKEKYLITGNQKLPLMLYVKTLINCLQPQISAFSTFILKIQLNCNEILENQLILIMDFLFLKY